MKGAMVGALFDFITMKNDEAMKNDETMNSYGKIMVIRV